MLDGLLLWHFLLLAYEKLKNMELKQSFFDFYILLYEDVSHTLIPKLQLALKEDKKLAVNSCIQEILNMGSLFFGNDIF